MTLINFEIVPIKESAEPLVDATKAGIFCEPVYYNQKLSPDKRLFLRKGVVEKLLTIEKELGKYKFKIWDCFRPREVQNKLFDKYYDDLKKTYPDWPEGKLKKETAFFITDGRDLDRIPPHLTGGSVDLTLAGDDNKELDMGTGFDFFGPEAAALYYEENDIDEKIRANRRLLREVMIKYDFRADPDEWWHFDYGNQLWAKTLNKPFAIYGEATPSVIPEPGG